MKRLLTIASALLFAVVAFGLLRAKEQSAREIISRSQQQQFDYQQRTQAQETDQKSIRQNIALQNRVAPITGQDVFTPAFAAWLLSGNFSKIPAALVPELRARLNLSENASSDFV